MALLPILQLALLQIMIIHQSTLPSAADPTQGFTLLPLNTSNFEIQSPYNLPVKERYSFTDGVHNFRVYSTDKGFWNRSKTRPRTEIRVKGYDYVSGVWQFEGYLYVPSGSSGVAIMQVFGGNPNPKNPNSTTLQLRVYDGSLTYYTSPAVAQNIYNRWIRANVIHDANASKVEVYIDGVLRYQGTGRGNATHYFKFGVYTQRNSSHYMESRWRDVKIFKKL